MCFYTMYDHFKYQMMSFGFFNAFINFQGYINKIFMKKIYIFVIFFLNDISIDTKDPGQSHIDRI